MNRDISLAWRINQFFALAWNGKLPPLSELLIGGEKKHGRQTGKQIAAALHVLADRYGYQVTNGPRTPHVH